MEIFYNHNQKRKWYFRLIAVIIFTAVCLLTFSIIWQVSHSEAGNKVVLDNNYYYSQNNNKKIALTFDDGPHPKNTRHIIGVLEKHNVPATFFMIGKNVMEHRKLVQIVDRQGFEIGNHTFTHSHDVHLSQERLMWELNLTNRLIEKAIGKNTKLYRPPFLLDIGNHPTYLTNQSSTIRENPLEWALQNGFYIIGADIDTKDWRAKSSQEIIDRFKKELAQKEKAHLVLMHDGGRGAKYTAQALDEIIVYLKQNDYQLVAASELFNLPQNKAILNIEHSGLGGWIYHLENLYLKIAYSLNSAVSLIYLTLIILLILKIYLVLHFLLIFKYNPQIKTENINKNNQYPKITAVIPAYNEAENIQATLLSLIQNSVQPDEILVIDDGSTDNTYYIARSLEEKYPTLIKVTKKTNGGKASALNLALELAQGEIIITLDGDSFFHKNAIANLIKHFKDSKVAAVSGRVDIAKSGKFISSLQEIEYLISQNMEKRAFSTIAAVPIVPGAIGAWRKSSLQQIGGFKQSTMVEDQDASLAILSLKQKIIYEEKAVAYTEAPSTFNSFFKQRFRWIFGTIQCVWKYKKTVLKIDNIKMGYLIMPHNIIYNIFIPLVSPLVDITIILSLFFGNDQLIIIYFLVFTAVDLILGSIAFAGQKKRKYLIFILPLQRIFYRQALFFVALKSIIKAIEGTRASWQKIDRVGTAKKFYYATNEKPRSANN